MGNMENMKHINKIEESTQVCGGCVNCIVATQNPYFSYLLKHKKIKFQPWVSAKIKPVNITWIKRKCFLIQQFWKKQQKYNWNRGQECLIVEKQKNKYCHGETNEVKNYYVKHKAN